MMMMKKNELIPTFLNYTTCSFRDFFPQDMGCISRLCEADFTGVSQIVDSFGQLIKFQM